MAQGDLKIGVIGAGGRGWLSQHAHRPGKGSRIVAACDVNQEALAAYRERYGSDLQTTSDYRDLLRWDVDAVFICSPDFLHEEQAVAALAAGKAVYLEKPMAITIEGCDRILRQARAAGARLFVGHNMRYMSIIRRMKKLVDDGAVGEVKSIWCRHFISYGGDAYFRDWHSERRYTTGLLLQKGAHDIDVMHWLAGAYSRRVAAFGNLAVYGRCRRRRPDEKGVATFNPAHWPPLAQTGFSPHIDIEDQTTMIMEMEGGVLGAYLQCHFTPDCCRNYTVIGTEGRLENLGDGPEDPIFVWNKRKDRYRLIGDEVHYGETSADGGHGGADPVIVEEFLRFAREGGVTTATPEAARMAVAAGYQATMSLREGGMPKDVPPLPRLD
ncbi:MAG: Gfo/Idh/MocA family oxidoreductase [Planctomycetota bacterium]|nr:Gfo/Idh/MocA family oxidoreductase [Planctomycetota bacterium]